MPNFVALFITPNDRLLCQPDPRKAYRDEKAEKEILVKVKEGMTEKDLTELARSTWELRLKQNIPDPPKALRSVPSLSERHSKGTYSFSHRGYNHLKFLISLL